jgi:O-succinylbenzoate synthase
MPIWSAQRVCVCAAYGLNFMLNILLADNSTLPRVVMLPSWAGEPASPATAVHAQYCLLDNWSPGCTSLPAVNATTTNCSLVRLTDGLSNKTDYTRAANNNGRMDRIYAVVGTYTVKYETYKVCEQAALFRSRGIAQRFTR